MEYPLSFFPTHKPLPDFSISSHASGAFGYGVFMENKWFNGRWSTLQLPLSIAHIACMAGVRKGGKSKWAQEGEGMACQDAIVLFVFFRPPDERKNPDWSDLMNYLIHPSDWSATSLKTTSSCLKTCSDLGKITRPPWHLSSYMTKFHPLLTTVNTLLAFLLTYPRLSIQSTMKFS